VLTPEYKRAYLPELFNGFYRQSVAGFLPVN